MIAVDLRPGIAGARRACLRALCGGDEALFQSGAPCEILALLERLFVRNGAGSLPPERVHELPVCDVDRIVASLFLREVGEWIESRTRCGSCGEGFDVSFSLREMVQAADETRTRGLDGVTGPDEEGIYCLSDGRRFRLPAMRDLDLVSTQTPEEAACRLRRACVLEGDPELDPDTLDKAMAAVGPILDSDLEAECPSCGETQCLRFEVQSYFGRALVFERRFLNQEVHQLARAYGWQRSEILAMTREDRRAHVRLILAEAMASQRRVAAI